MPRQLVLDLPSKTAMGRDDFLVAPANQMAVAALERWSDWPGGKFLLTGGPGSGKTHLAHVWAAEAGARVLPAASLGAAATPPVPDGPTCIAIDDIDAIAGDAGAETALFHLHNMVIEAGGRLLMTASAGAGQLPFGLADLKSRVQAADTARLAPPDDTLLAAVLVKLFADRQLSVGPTVINFLVKRMDRSFAAARAIVSALDTEALASRRAVTRPLASKVLNRIGAGG